jgi:hypothetical protein
LLVLLAANELMAMGGWLARLWQRRHALRAARQKSGG